MSAYLPISIKLDGLCVVIGGGKVAERKVRALLNAGARIRVVCTDATSQLRAWGSEGSIELVIAPYERKWLNGALLVFACTDDAETNARVANDARELGMLVNVADEPSLCTFIMPAVLRRGKVTIAVDTQGASPALSVIIRDSIAGIIGSEHAALCALLEELRAEMKANIRMPMRRTQMLRDAISRGVLDRLRAGSLEGAKELLRECILSWSD